MATELDAFFSALRHDADELPAAAPDAARRLGRRRQRRATLIAVLAVFVVVGTVAVAIGATLPKGTPRPAGSPTGPPTAAPVPLGTVTVQDTRGCAWSRTHLVCVTSAGINVWRFAA